MKFNTQVCTTREQSERLLSLGLKKETADCRWVGLVKDAKGNDIPTKKQAWFTQTREDERAMVCGFMRYDFIPAWSLHRLVSIMPNAIGYVDEGGEEWGAHLYVDKHVAQYDAFPIDVIRFDRQEKLYDNLIDCIEWLIKENHFNKQYLNESL